MRTLIVILVAALLVAAGVYVVAGRAAGPTIQIHQPGKFIGQAGTLDVSVEAPAGKFTRVDVTLEQGGHSIPLFNLSGTTESVVRQETVDRIRITRSMGRRSLPELQPGAARLQIMAARPVLFGFRTASATASRDLQVRLDPPRLAVLSNHHYINHGGSEMVVYRVTPPDVESGVRVGDISYPGFPAAGAVAGGDPALKLAFFALLYDQDVDTPISAYAKDEAGNQATVILPDFRAFEKPFKRSRIELEDGFLRRVVPEILQHEPELKVAAGPSNDPLPGFLKINGDLRRMNTATIASMASRTSPQMLWKGAFRQLGGSQVESSFADHRTYFYRGKEVDQQVHLGFDLAVTANVPVLAANDGRVVNADYLGIYGNCVIIDHGMGVQSLYGHLSSFEVGSGDRVEKGQTIGRSGMSGLAGGDHLHFTMLVNGRPVNPVEWWDPHWIQDRVLRKLSEAGAARATAAPTSASARPFHATERARAAN